MLDGQHKRDLAIWPLLSENLEGTNLASSVEGGKWGSATNSHITSWPTSFQSYRRVKHSAAPNPAPSSASHFHLHHQSALITNVHSSMFLQLLLSVKGSSGSLPILAASHKRQLLHHTFSSFGL